MFKTIAGKPAGEYDTTVWNKEKQAGAVIEGTYIRKELNVQGKVGSNIFVIENDEGKWAVWSSKMLEDCFLEIQIGTKVRITFVNKVKTKGGRDLNQYKVEADDGTGETESPKSKKGALPFD